MRMAGVLKCGICLVFPSSGENDYFCTTTCGHVFHYQCIKRWLHSDFLMPRCPICLNTSCISVRSLVKLHGINPVLECGNDGEKYNLKVVLLGDSGTGKTSLLTSFGKGEFQRDAGATTGCDMTFKTLDFAGKRIKLTLWDCAGQERFRAVCPSYIRNSHGVCILYDVTKSDTLQSLDAWLELIYQTAPPDVSMMLVGNKTDLKRSRQVSTQKGLEIATKHGFEFIETSAKSLYNVEATFRLLIGKILEGYWDNGFIDSIEMMPAPKSVKLHEPNTCTTSGESVDQANRPRCSGRC